VILPDSGRRGKNPLIQERRERERNPKEKKKKEDKNEK